MNSFAFYATALASAVYLFFFFLCAGASVIASWVRVGRMLGSERRRIDPNR